MRKSFQFMVNGKPFLSLGAQTHNSSSFQLHEMDRAYNSVKALGGNTIATPVSWQRFEPREGEFDKKYVTDIIEDVRKHGLKLIILWFASWKNATMEYCPEWVICDTKRFQRVLLKDGTPVHVLSSHSEINKRADAKAFCELLKVIKEFDEKEQTVIGVQVENEVGIGALTRRDFSELGTRDFNSDVPAELIDYAKKTDGQLNKFWVKNGCVERGNWAEVFGRFGAEACTAWSIAKYVDYIAMEGKKVYDIFLYINAALDGGIKGTGWDIAGVSFSAGGPTLRNRDIYYCACQHLDAIAPDNYQSDILRHYEMTDGYANPEKGWPLFVPESAANSLNSTAIFYACGEKQAIGYHIFGAESILNDDGTLTPGGEMMSHSMHMLSNFAPMILKYRGTNKLHSIIQHVGETSYCIEFEGWRCKVSFVGPGYGWNAMDYMHRQAMKEEGSGIFDFNAEKGKGMIVQTQENEFFIVGHKVRLSFSRYEDVDGSISPTLFNAMAQNNYTEYIEVTEGHFDEDGRYVVDRVRTGDESRQGLWAHWDCGVIHVRLKPQDE